jgi:hypothetical protein
MKKYFEMSNEELELELKKEKSIEYDAYWKFTRCAAKSCGSLVEQMSQAAKNKRDILSEIRKRKNEQK